jgi:tetratricopeptide (TPR) repeat protein
MRAEGAAALQEAAEAARHLGALAFLDSTQKAIDAYATATRLDPGHTWSWIYLGLLHQQSGNLIQAGRAFDQAQEAAERAGHERDRSVAQAYLGDVRVGQGNLSDAIAAYEAALSVHRRLSEYHPDDTDRQRDLSVSFERIGGVQSARGNLDGAEGLRGQPRDS